MTYVRVTDLCGRDAPFVTEEAYLDDDTRDVLAELDGDTVYIGEMQYDYLPEDHADVAAYLAAA